MLTILAVLLVSLPFITGNACCHRWVLSHGELWYSFMSWRFRIRSHESCNSVKQRLVHTVRQARTQIIQLGHILQSTTKSTCRSTQPHHAKNSKPNCSRSKVRDSHLHRCFTLPTWIKLTTTPRCVPHILTGNVGLITTQCLRQNKV